MAAEPDTFDAPSEGDSEVAPRTLTAWRVVLRFVVMVLALLLVDLAVKDLFPAPDYRGDWRLPRTMPTSEIAGAVDFLDALARDPRPVVAFVGASPAWGDAVRSPAQTVPARYAAAAADSGRDVAVVNLASNGQLPADQYFVAMRAAQSADVVVVQLTYHAFNPAWRNGVIARYPELASMLGVPVPPPLATALDREPTPRFDITGAVDRLVRDRWALYGGRDRIAARAFGAAPDSRVFSAWERFTDPAFAGDDQQLPTGEPFSEIEPEQQMFILDEFAGAADYRFSPRDPEAVALDQLAADLARRKTEAVFYVSPVNIGVLEENGLHDAAGFARNVAAMRAVIERHGYRLIDLNDEPLSPEDFADINHTTAAGSDAVGRMLWERTRAEVSTP